MKKVHTAVVQKVQFFMAISTHSRQLYLEFYRHVMGKLVNSPYIKRQSYKHEGDNLEQNVNPVN